MKLKILCLISGVRLWIGDNDFTITCFDSDVDENYVYATIAISHDLLKEPYLLSVKKEKGQIPYMEFGEDNWEPIIKENVFSWMWFEHLQPSP